MPVAIPLAIAGSTLAGAAISSSASRRAASTQQQGTDAAIAEQRRQFDEMVRLSRPGLDRANSAAGTYMQALGLGGGGGQPQTMPPQPGGYQGQPGGVQSGGYGGSGWNGGGTIQQAMVGDTAYNPAQRLMTGGEDYSGPQVYTGGAMPGGPQTLPGQPAQPGPTGQLDIIEQVRNTPGYQGQLDQGIKAIDRAAPLVGGMYSGRRMKALNDHGQQTFGAYYGDWMNRVGGIAGQAPQIAQNVGQAGMNNANNVGNLLMTGANNRAQGQMNSASAWTGALGSMAGMAGGFYG